MKGKIIKTYVEKEKGEEISIAHFINDVEGGGSYKEGTAVKALKECGLVRTNFAIYEWTGELE